MAGLTAFRSALQDHLEAQLGIPFETGLLEGPIEDRTVGCCWTAGVREWAQDVNIEEIFVTVRVFKQWKLVQGLNNPSVSDLESLVEDLQVALKSVQTALGPWQFRLTEVEVDVASNGIEGTIVAMQANPFAIGG